MLLDDIDRHAQTSGVRTTMDIICDKLDGEQRETLEAACGLTHDGKHRREWSVIARWLMSLQVTSKNVDGKQVAAWAGKRHADV